MYVKSKMVDAAEYLDCKAPDDCGFDCDVLGDDEARVYHANGLGSLLSRSFIMLLCINVF